MAPGLELLLQDCPIDIEVIEALNKVTLCAVCDGYYDSGVVHSVGLVLR
jgi:hypothetical protein